MLYSRADLEFAEQQVAEAKTYIVSQELLISRMLFHGESTVWAEDLLEIYHVSLQLLCARRDRIADELLSHGLIS